MKILSNPENRSMICVLPNGATVEVEQISMSGNKSVTEYDIDQVMSIVKQLPHHMLSNSQNYLI